MGKENRTGLLAVSTRWHQARWITRTGSLPGAGRGNRPECGWCGNHQLHSRLAALPPAAPDGEAEFTTRLRWSETEMVPSEDAFPGCLRAGWPHGFAGIRWLAMGQLLVPAGPGGVFQAGGIPAGPEGTGSPAVQYCRPMAAGRRSAAPAGPTTMMDWRPLCSVPCEVLFRK